VHPAVQRNLFVVKEHVGVFKAANNFDIFDPQTGQEILHCREEKLGGLTKLLRFTDAKRMTPFDVEIRRPDGPALITVKRGVSLLLSRVDVLDPNGLRIGGFQQKLFSIGGRFDILDVSDTPVCTLKGKWTGWNFKFMAGDDRLAEVSKKWSGIGKEMFTTADTYALQIDDSVESDHPVRLLIFAAVMCIDLVLKE